MLIGYGTARKSYMTDSFAIVSSKVFNKGLVSSPEQLINGKVSGVQIMSNSGSASAGSTIRVRGGASLNASNVLLSYSMVYHWNKVVFLVIPATYAIDCTECFPRVSLLIINQSII